MTIKYAFTPDGGFVCGDTETGVTKFNPSWSLAAQLAADKPRYVAAAVVHFANAATDRGSPEVVKEYDRLNWERLGGREERKNG